MASHGASAADYREKARKAEDLGYSTWFVPDHFVDHPVAPMPAMAMVAEATETLRVGTLVLGNDYKHPVVLAREAATLDLLSDGRLELGIGAGWMTADYEKAGIPLDKPSLRIDKARLPYNLNGISQRLASVVLSELSEPIAGVLAGVISERQRLAAELSVLPGISVTPSQANFLWLHTERPAGEVFEALCQRKILVRSFHERGGRLAHQLRVTIGTPAENDEFLSCLRGVT